MHLSTTARQHTATRAANNTQQHRRTAHNTHTHTCDATRAPNNTQQHTAHNNTIAHTPVVLLEA